MSAAGAAIGPRDGQRWPQELTADGWWARLVSVAVSEQILLATIVTFAFVVRAILALTMTPWQSPDEPKHFEYVRVLVDQRAKLWAERRLPNIGDTDLAFQPDVIRSLAQYHYWGPPPARPPDPLPARFEDIWPQGTHTQLHRPSIYYFLAAPVVALFRGASLEAQLVAARFVSVLMSTATVWLVALTARALIPSDPFVMLVSAAFVAALPMHLYIGGSVNTDNLATLIGTVCLLFVARGLRYGFGVGAGSAVVVLLVLGLATKRVMVGIGPAIAVAGLFWLVSLRGWRLAVGLSGLGLALLAAVNVLGPGVGLGWLPLDRLRGWLVEYALNHPAQLEALLGGQLTSPETLKLIAGHQDAFFRSFWGVFGWFALHLSPELYEMLKIATGLCTAGFVVWLARQVMALRAPGAGAAWRSIAIGTVFVVAIVSMIVLAEGERLAYFSAGEIPQGRYLFAVVAPIAVVLAAGARVYLPSRLFGRALPLALVLLTLALLDLEVFGEYLLPFFQARLPA